MPLYIAKSGDLDRCYRCLTDSLTDSLTTLKDRATQLLIKYKSGALVTQWKHKYKHNNEHEARDIETKEAAVTGCTRLTSHSIAPAPIFLQWDENPWWETFVFCIYICSHPNVLAKHSKRNRFEAWVWRYICWGLNRKILNVHQKIFAWHRKLKPAATHISIYSGTSQTKAHNTHLYSRVFDKEEEEEGEKVLWLGSNSWCVRPAHPA